MDDDRLIRSAEELRALIGEIPGIARDKVLDRLDRHAQRFIELSPFLCLSTQSPSGGVDVSPRGDAPGFVKTTDPQTLYIPDRPGNRRIDSMMSILLNPAVGLIFFVPGIAETLRVHGRAVLVTGRILDTMKAGKAVPRLAIRVSVESAYFHCGKALIRSRLWSDDYRIDRQTFPTFGRILRDQIDEAGSVDAYEELVQKDYDESLY